MEAQTGLTGAAGQPLLTFCLQASPFIHNENDRFQFKVFVILYASIDILHIVSGFVAYYAKHMHFSIF